MPLRDIEIRLLDQPSSPLLAAPAPWRGLTEGCARALPGRGPVWTKAPFTLRSATIAGSAQSPPVEGIPIAVSIAPVPAGPSHRPLCPALQLVPTREWDESWLKPVTGSTGRRCAESFDWLVKPTVQPPQHIVARSATGRAGKLQSRIGLPEPWVEVQAGAYERAPEIAQPIHAAPSEPQLPLLPPTTPVVSDQRLGYGEIEKPGTRWILLRGSQEAATFRLALDHLRLQEPGAPETEWGPVKSHSRETRPAGMPPSRGIVHRELCLQQVAAQPLLEPVVCQFGPARGGIWESRK
jgi:hypothetical protein